MQTLIYAKVPDLGPVFRAWAESRIERALRPFRARVESVQVFLQNTAHGRDDDAVLCRLVLEAQGGSTLVTTGRGQDAHDALSEALGKARARVRRNRGRVSTRPHRGRHVRRDLRRAA